MPQRKKVKNNTSNTAAQKTQGGGASEPDPQTAEGNGEGERVGDGAPKPVKGGLKEFVEQFKDRHYYIIEMRIVLICCVAVFFKIFFSDVIGKQDHSLTYCSLALIALCIAVIVFSTWMDYFPSKLVEIQPRECKGQGLPMASLFVPMVGCAQLYFSLRHASQMTALLEVYVVVLCFLSFCSILATLVHSIPHPNHIVVYNFALLAASYALQTTIEVSMWFTLPAASVYSLLGVWLLNVSPKTFTLGEVVIVSQSITLVAVDTTLQLLTLYEYVSVPESFQFPRNEAVLYLELLVVGVAICCLLLSPALYKLTQSKHLHERKFWSSTFVLLSLGVGFMLVLPWLGRLIGGHNPILFVILTCISYRTRLVLMGAWFVVCLLTGLIVCAQSSTSSWSSRFKADQSSPWLRKSFHLSAMVVYITGTAIDPKFTSLAASLVTFLFIVMELVRMFRMWPCGDYLHQLHLPFLADCDSGHFVVSHIYLLLGFSLPLWLCPITNYHHVAKLSMYSGVLSLGVGDAVASIAGKLYGTVKWPGTKKTFMGSLASILAQILVILIIVLMDWHIPSLSLHHWGVIMGSIVITTALEAYTWQVDNLLLAAFQYTLLITFLN